MIMPAKMRENGNFSNASLKQLHSVSISCTMSPNDAADLQSPLIVGIQVSVLQLF